MRNFRLSPWPRCRVSHGGGTPSRENGVAFFGDVSHEASKTGANLGACQCEMGGGPFRLVVTQFIPSRQWLLSQTETVAVYLINHFLA